MIISSFGEIDMEAVSDEQVQKWLDQLDIINQGRVRYLENLTDFLYEGLRPKLIQDGLLFKPEGETEVLEEQVERTALITETPGKAITTPKARNSPFPESFELPHATVGKLYNYTFELEKFYNGHILSPEVEGLEGVRGMEFSVSDMVLKGKPKEPGIYDMILICLREDQMDRDVMRFQFVVEPDLSALPASIEMPLARVDDDYQEVVKLDRSYKFNFQLEGAAETGLEFDSDNMLLLGTPTRAGEFEFTLHFSWEGMRKQMQGSIQIILKVEEAKESFWKNVFPDSNSRFPKPLEEQKLIDAHAHWIIGASRRGLRHMHLGLHREDDFQMRFSKSLGWTIIAVADGHIDAGYARKGSELATKVAEQVVLKRLEDYFSKNKVEMDSFLIPKNEEGEIKLKAFLNHILTTAIYNAFLYIKRFAESESLNFKDFGTSMKLLICYPLAKKGFFIAGTSIGEGMIGIYHDKTHKLHLIQDSLPVNEDGSRHLMTDSIITEKTSLLNNNLHWFFVEDFSIITLMSGGMQDVLFFGDHKVDSPKSWSHYWQLLKKQVMYSKNDQYSQSLLNWIENPSENKEAFEDRTLVIMTRKTGG